MADKYVENLLHKWNMSCLISTFQGKGVDTVAFNSLDHSTISELIPHKDLRQMFKTKYNQHKTLTSNVEDDHALIDVEVSISEDIDLIEEPKEEDIQIKSELQSSSFDIEFILRESPNGKQVIDTYSSLGHLDYASSMCLSNILIDFLISQSDDYSIDNDVLDEIADAIIFRFPNEKKDAYYDFSGKNPRGNLIECYYNVRSRLIKQDNMKKKQKPTPEPAKKVAGGKQKSQSNSQRQSQAAMPEWVEVEGATSGDLVNLKWDPYKNILLRGLPHLLENEKFVDMTIICEEQSIKCHKVVLSSYSTHFEKMLSSSPCEHPVIFLADIHFWEIRALIDFMYKGELNIEERKLTRLFQVATKLSVEGLANINIQENGEDIYSTANSDLRTSDTGDPLSGNPSVSSRKRKNTSSLATVLGSILTNNGKQQVSKKSKQCQNKVFKGSNNSKITSQNPFQGPTTKNNIRTDHKLTRIPNRSRRICRVCMKKAYYWCPGCNCGVHIECFPNLGHVYNNPWCRK